MMLGTTNIKPILLIHGLALERFPSLSNKTLNMHLACDVTCLDVFCFFAWTTASLFLGHDCDVLPVGRCSWPGLPAPSTAIRLGFTPPVKMRRYIPCVRER